MKRKKKPPMRGKIVTRAMMKKMKADLRLMEEGHKTAPIHDPVIKFKLDEERDAKIQNDKDLERARLIYEDWKHKFINRRKPLDEIAAAVNDLAIQLDTEITSPFKDYLINVIINPLIAYAHDSAIMDRYSVKALVDCPHNRMVREEGEKKGRLIPCGWGGIAAFHVMTWERGVAHMDCPQCGKLLKQKDDMMPESESRAWYESQKGKAKQ